MNDPKPFAVQCKNFFGYLPGQTMSGFMAELKSLTTDDRKELAELLTRAGYPVSASDK